MDAFDVNIDLLCIDEDDAALKLTEQVFKKVNALLKIVKTKSGPEALKKLYGHEGEHKIHPKVILLDINSPKTQGLEFLKRVRGDSTLTDVAVFILTHAYTTENKLAVQDLNVRGHIIKPLEYEDALNIFWTLQT